MIEIDYISFHSDGPEHVVILSSNANIISTISSEKSLVGADLVCSLTEDNDFSLEHHLPYSMLGRIPKDYDPAVAPGGRYQYAVQVNFIRTSADGSTERPLEIDSVKQLLHDKELIPCRVIGRLYGSSPYYSPQISIPSADILRHI